MTTGYQQRPLDLQERAEGRAVTTGHQQRPLDPQERTEDRAVASGYQQRPLDPQEGDKGQGCDNRHWLCLLLLERRPLFS